ncbi:MAG TPA: FAD-linked oxidase C-terminal domain-containing protein, partial [Roseovarius sp.]|nr:FAD-linked oxidase C-terminal domain-containing protein [Roseovarius sp.]
GSDTGVTEQAETFGDIAAGHGATGFDWATRAEERTRLWTMRHNAYHAILASRPGSRAVVTDLCVPISKLAQAIEETQADLTKAALSGPILGHVGDGNFHAILMFDEGDAAATERAKDVHHRMVQRALALGGTATGEHGVGIGKRPYMTEEHGAAWGVMGHIKKAFDPQNILNPGKLVPPRN